MSYNGSGLFSITTGGQPVVGGTTIDATVFNNLTADLATGLSTAICKDGQTTITANLPMNSKKLTGLADGSSRSDSSTIGNIVDGTGVYVATVGGTVDVIILTTAPAITVYSAGQHFYFIAAGANTSNVTVNVSGMGAKAITKNGTTALVANDILANMMVRIIYDGTRFILGAHLTADTVTLTGTQTLTNKTITSPTFSGAAAGSLTSLALTSAVLTTSTAAADPSANLGLATKQYVDASALRAGGYLWGLALSNNVGDAVNDMDIAVGESSSDDVLFANRLAIVLAAGLTKQLDVTWAVGTNQGMRASGAAIANTTYHIFLILRPDTSVVDIAADTSITGANLAANTNAAYTKKRRIGSILREAATIIPFVQDGDVFRRKASSLDVNTTNPGTVAVTATLSVPLGMRVKALFNVEIYGAGSGESIYVSDLSVNDEAVAVYSAVTVAAPGMTISVNGAGQTIGSQVEVMTNTSSQVRYRCSASGGGQIVGIVTYGWTDTRGRIG